MNGVDVTYPSGSFTLSGAMLNITHTASKVTRTPMGGLLNCFTTEMSAVVSVSSAFNAEFKTGIAFARPKTQAII